LFQQIVEAKYLQTDALELGSRPTIDLGTTFSGADKLF